MHEDSNKGIRNNMKKHNANDTANNHHMERRLQWWGEAIVGKSTVSGPSRRNTATKPQA